MSGLSTHGVKFYMAAKVTSGSQTYTEVANLQTFPDLLGNAESIDVTCLGDSYRHYIAGIKDLGSDIQFGFLYDNSTSTSNFRVCKSAEGTLQAVKIEFPDTTTFTFDAYVNPTVVGKGVNEALTFNLNVKINSDITVTNPSI